MQRNLSKLSSISIKLYKLKSPEFSHSGDILSILLLDKDPHNLSSIELHNRKWIQPNIANPESFQDKNSFNILKMSKLNKISSKYIEL
jgi:hypothetical protein